MYLVGIRRSKLQCLSFNENMYGVCLHICCSSIDYDYVCTYITACVCLYTCVILEPSSGSYWLAVYVHCSKKKHVVKEEMQARVPSIHMSITTSHGGCV